MKNALLFLVLALPVHALAPACSDFSGRYLGVDGDQDFVMELTQSGCQKIQGHHTYIESGLEFPRNMVFDDVFREVSRSTSYVQWEKHRIDGGQISYVVEYRYTGGRVMRTLGTWVRDATGDILEKQSFHDEHGALIGQTSSFYGRR